MEFYYLKYTNKGVILMKNETAKIKLARNDSETNLNHIHANSKKGQVAFEFLLIYSFFIFVFLATLYIISGQAINQQKYAEGMYAREFIISIADEINAASTIQGYEKNLSIPKTISGVPYQIYIYRGLIGLNYTSITNIDLLYPLATDRIFIKRGTSNIDTSTTGSPIQINTSKGYVILENDNGVVVIHND